MILDIPVPHKSASLFCGAQPSRFSSDLRILALVPVDSVLDCDAALYSVFRARSLHRDWLCNLDLDSCAAWLPFTVSASAFLGPPSPHDLVVHVFTLVNHKSNCHNQLRIPRGNQPNKNSALLRQDAPRPAHSTPALLNLSLQDAGRNYAIQPSLLDDVSHFRSLFAAHSHTLLSHSKPLIRRVRLAPPRLHAPITSPAILLGRVDIPVILDIPVPTQVRGETAMHIAPSLKILALMLQCRWLPFDSVPDSNAALCSAREVCSGWSLLHALLRTTRSPRTLKPPRL
ncbi:hypothetical protein FB451DRAFT_1413281 [Mycena latifolia]|nr:hypothetical protein FB451DRAFT_1413281 [Mycena latifolia]